MTDYVRVNFLVEGQTEETFVRDVLAEPLLTRQLLIVPRCVETKLGGARGGMTTYAKAKRDIQNWLKADNTAYVTTMFDLYGLPADFPGQATLPTQAAPSQKAAHLETALAADIGHRHFIPYLQLHEFEALLFSEVEAIDQVLSLYAPSQLAALQAARQAFATPEEINDDPTTAPSKRLQKLFAGYDKVGFGLRIAQHIGLATLRRECPHFNAWLARLETLPPL